MIKRMLKHSPLAVFQIGVAVAARRARAQRQTDRFERYRRGIRPDHPLAAAPMHNMDDVSADPSETISHYDSFAYWVGSRIKAQGLGLSVLDVGGKKGFNALMSVYHDVTALVLADCHDDLSRVRYIVHDVGKPLPLEDARFDVFTSPVSLHTVGLARYGDELDPNALVTFLADLQRVMKPEASLFVSLPYGRTMLNYNNGWVLDMPSIQALFSGWDMVDHLIDNWSSTVPAGSLPHFTQDLAFHSDKPGAYRVVFLHFQRGKAASR